MNAQIRDDDFIPFIHGKMMGKMLLEPGWTEHDEIEMYKNSDHVNYFTPSGNGFLCVSIYEDFVIIPFAWYDMSFKGRKEMVRLGKELYQHYTTDQDKPIYYTGLKNFYGHHCKRIAENVWQFVV